MGAEVLRGTVISEMENSGAGFVIPFNRLSESGPNWGRILE
jgi:hypothetical protein